MYFYIYVTIFFTFGGFSERSTKCISIWFTYLIISFTFGGVLERDQQDFSIINRRNTLDTTINDLREDSSGEHFFSSIYVFLFHLFIFLTFLGFSERSTKFFPLSTGETLENTIN